MPTSNTVTVTQAAAGSPSIVLSASGSTSLTYTGGTVPMGGTSANLPEGTPVNIYDNGVVVMSTTIYDLAGDLQAFSLTYQANPLQSEVTHDITAQAATYPVTSNTVTITIGPAPAPPPLELTVNGETGTVSIPQSATVAFVIAGTPGRGVALHSNFQTSAVFEGTIPASGTLSGSYYVDLPGTILTATDNYGNISNSVTVNITYQGGSFTATLTGPTTGSPGVELWFTISWQGGTGPFIIGPTFTGPAGYSTSTPGGHLTSPQMIGFTASKTGTYSIEVFVTDEGVSGGAGARSNTITFTVS